MPVDRALPDEWPVRRSALLTAAAYGFGVVALSVTSAYLDPPANATWLNLGIAAAVLAMPLWGLPPLTRTRLLVAAVVWTALGLPGGYVFGVAPFLAGGLLLALLALDNLRSRRRTPPRPRWDT